MLLPGVKQHIHRYSHISAQTLYSGSVKFNILLGATKPVGEVTQDEIDQACRDGAFRDTPFAILSLTACFLSKHPRLRDFAS